MAVTKDGLTRVGPDRCKICHRVQYASWAESAHAARKPPLACESCHGPGSEYKTKSVMEDAAKAKAAGLVVPTREFCATCHKGKISDAMLEAVHAHKGS